MAWLEWLGSLPHAALLRRSATLYLLVNAAHITGIGLLIGAILPLDLRLMGVLREGPINVLAPFLVRVAATGLALVVLTGFLLFSVKPVEYAENPAFLTKMGLLAAGLVNVLVQHRGASWRPALIGGDISVSVRLLAAASFAIWIGAIVAGRWIGFV
ncbi:DUF2214 domain-containing protein [Rhizobium sp. TH2]|uniref:DUF6644 family protein n=1 Tax=Rhizobium sp. TH2 TaxID=2775403 RepID=UPI002157C4F9|nr:DUF6644 family protein [Rhizobium sp. TH2]UVC10124.1 DUF2214 domain-containing protein [Rhizobium sp. TH2]